MVIGSAYLEDVIIIQLYVPNKILHMCVMYDETTWAHW